MSSPFASSYRQLSTLGFHTVPVLPGQKAIQERKWTKWCRRPPTEQELSRFSRRPNANIGAALGTPVGDGTFVICIDIDCRGESEVERIKSAIPHSPMARFGSKGLALLYRAPPEIRSARYQRVIGHREDGKPIMETTVEVLSYGKQVVLPPSIHPDTGRPYIWIGRPVNVCDLPLFDEDALAELEEVAEAIGWTPSGGKVGDHSMGACDDREASNDDSERGVYAVFCRYTNDEAFNRLSRWGPALDLYELQAKPGGYRAVATWRESNTGRPLEQRGRKLSIDYRGIVDYGAGVGYTPLDLVMACQGYSLNDAIEFIWEQAGLRAELDAFCQLDITKELERMQEMRAIEEVDNTAMQGERHLTEAADGTLHDPLTGEVLPTPALPTPVNDNRDDRDFPERLTHVPGLLGDMVAYIIDTSRRPSRALALGSALVTLGTIIGRRDETPTHSGTHLYVIALAPSGAGKDHPQDAGILMLEDAVKAFDDADDDLVGAPDFMSQTGYLRELEERPLRASFMDEFGAFLAKVNAPRASSHEVMIKKVLLEVWGRSFSVYRTPVWAGIRSKRIEWPCYSIFGASTPRVFYDALQGDDRENGFLNRMLFLPSFTKPAMRDPKYHRADIPESLSGQLRAAFRIGRGLLPPGGIPQKRHVGWECLEPEAMWDAFVKECDESDLGGFCVRSAEMAGRLATILAVGRQIEVDRPTVSFDDIKWGIEVARWSAQRMAKDAGAYVADNPVGRDRSRILGKLNSAPGKRVSRSDIMRDLGFKSLDLNNHIRDLKETGQIATQMVAPAGGGPSKMWLVAA